MKALALTLTADSSRPPSAERTKFGNNTPSIRAFGMFTWAHAVVRNNFQKRLSNMLAVKNALLQSAVICHLKYLSFSKLNASVLNTGLFTVDKMLTNIGKNCRGVEITCKSSTMVTFE